MFSSHSTALIPKSAVRCRHIAADVVARPTAQRTHLVDQQLPTANGRVFAAATKEACETGVVVQDGEQVIDDGSDYVIAAHSLIQRRRRLVHVRLHMVDPIALHRRAAWAWHPIYESRMNRSAGANHAVRWCSTVTAY